MIRLIGHLTRPGLQEKLGEVELSRDGRVALVVDCTEMTGYDAEARAAFVRWNAAYKDRVCAVGVVTSRPMWRLVVSAMAVASRQHIRAFDTLEGAKQWARATGEA